MEQTGTIRVERCVALPLMKDNKSCPSEGYHLEAVEAGAKLSASCSLCNAFFIEEIKEDE